MKTEQFLQHHGIKGNPFSEEDAQTDTVFKRRASRPFTTRPGTSFSAARPIPPRRSSLARKGSGKTALRLQAMSELEAYNQAHPGERVFVISYDDFNPYLDHFRQAIRATRHGRGPDAMATSRPHGCDPVLKA